MNNYVKLKNDLNSLSQKPLRGVEIDWDSVRANSCCFYITPSKGTLYEYMTYKLRIYYPFQHGTCEIMFYTPIFHPNIDETGLLSTYILKCYETSEFDLRSIFESIFYILDNPVEDSKDINNLRANVLFRTNKTYFKQNIVNYYKNPDIKMT